MKDIQIKQLAEQADELADNEIQMPGEYHPDWHTIRDKKFAELIVRECVGIGDNYQEILGNEPECFNCRKVAYGIVDKIKQHFGLNLYTQEDLDEAHNRGVELAKKLRVE